MIHSYNRCAGVSDDVILSQACSHLISGSKYGSWGSPLCQKRAWLSCMLQNSADGGKKMISFDTDGVI